MVQSCRKIIYDTDFAHAKKEIQIVSWPVEAVAANRLRRGGAEHRARSTNRNVALEERLANLLMVHKWRSHRYEIHSNQECKARAQKNSIRVLVHEGELYHQSVSNRDIVGVHHG